MADRFVDFLLIGGGVAGASCAAKLREEGADGRILLVGRGQRRFIRTDACVKRRARGS